MRPLVIGIGNTDRGDDGAGPVAAGLLERSGLTGALVMTCRGDPADLVTAWQEHVAVIAVDACVSGAEPGTVFRLDAVRDPLPEGFGAVSTHGFGLAAAVELARAMQCLPSVLTVYGIEAAGFDVGAPLSAPVATACRAVADEIAQDLQEALCTKPA